MMQKLFEMVETYTQRIISLESELRNVLNINSDNIDES